MKSLRGFGILVLTIVLVVDLGVRFDGHERGERRVRR